MKRVLIWYVSIGSGHLSAARAIAAALQQRTPGLEARIEDAFGWERRPRGLTDLLSGFSTVVIPGIYDWAWRTGAMRAFFTLSTWMPQARGKVLRVTRAFQPDVIVCTHALPCAILAGQRLPAPLLGVATDFDVHPYWPVQRTQAFVTATDAAREKVVGQGAAPERVHVFGIPVQPDFVGRASQPDQPGNGLNVLMLAGGGTLGPYLPVIARVREILDLLAIGPVTGVRWTVVFGKNQSLLDAARRHLAGREDVRLFGFTSEMPALMAAADLVITKPGGLALAETLALGKPVALLQRGAGQERANSNAVLEAGAGVMIQNGQSLFDFLERLKNQPEIYQQLRERACALGAPLAAQRTAVLIERLARDAHGE